MGSEAAFIAIWERLKGVMVNDTFIKHEFVHFIWDTVFMVFVAAHLVIL